MFRHFISPWTSFHFLESDEEPALRIIVYDLVSKKITVKSGEKVALLIWCKRRLDHLNAIPLILFMFIRLSSYILRWRWDKFPYRIYVLVCRIKALHFWDVDDVDTITMQLWGSVTVHISQFTNTMERCKIKRRCESQCVCVHDCKFNF